MSGTIIVSDVKNTVDLLPLQGGRPSSFDSSGRGSFRLGKLTGNPKNHGPTERLRFSNITLSNQWKLGKEWLTNFELGLARPAK